MHRSISRAVVAFALLTAAVPTLGAAAQSPDPIADAIAIREATLPFRGVDAATDAGYGILVGTPLEACIDEPGQGAMGFHHVNGDLVGDAVLDPLTPEALIYIPDAIGEPELVGVEYVVFAGGMGRRRMTLPQRSWVTRCTWSRSPTATSCHRSTSSTRGCGGATRRACSRPGTRP